MTDENRPVETQPKTQAEIDAEVAARLSEATKNEAEAAYYEAQTRRELALAGQEECELHVAEINRSIAAELRKRQLSANSYHHVYQFAGKVTDTSVDSCIAELSYWHRQCKADGNAPCPMTIVFYSPGGAVFPGMALYDYLGYLKAQGHHVTTVCSGWAASMGAVLMQAGDTRVMGPESFLLLHEVSGGAIGSTGEIEDTVELIKKMNKRIAGIFASRSKMSLATVEKKMTRKDWSLTSTEALAIGLCDEVR